MNERRSNVFAILILTSLILVFSVAGLMKEDELYSGAEGRELAQKPGFTWESFWDGAYARSYETYVQDQFAGRTKWVMLRKEMDTVLKKREKNGVYLGNSGHLFKAHNSLDYPKDMIQAQIEKLDDIIWEWDAKVMIFPSADYVNEEYLPAHAPVLNQKHVLEKLELSVGADHLISITDTLRKHRKEDLFYKTEDKWTSLGAYYAYLDWVKFMDYKPYPYKTSNLQIVLPNFRGNLERMTEQDWGNDSISYFKKNLIYPMSVLYDEKQLRDSVFEESRLDSEDPYGFFLDYRHSTIDIKTNNGKRRTLVVLGGSNAYTMIPLLLPHYGRVYFIDTGVCEETPSIIMNRNLNQDEKAEVDVLVLYDCVEFLEEFRY